MSAFETKADLQCLFDALRGSARPDASAVKNQRANIDSWQDPMMAIGLRGLLCYCWSSLRLGKTKRNKAKQLGWGAKKCFLHSRWRPAGNRQNAETKENIRKLNFMAKKPKPSLQLVRSDEASTGTQPRRDVGVHGRKLWDDVMREYAIEDSGGLEMLAQACQALDRAEALREEIDRDGAVIRARGMAKDHPALST
jgi:hypothetical protein